MNRSTVCLSLFFLLAGGPLVHAQQKDLFQPMDIFRLEYAADPQISPDGKRVVYVRNFMDIKKDRRRPTSGSST